MSVVPRVVLLAFVVLSAVAHAIASPTVILGSNTEANVCVGVLLSPLHVLVRPWCAEKSNELTLARTLAVSDADLSLSQASTTQISVIRTTAVILRDQQRLHILTLGSAMPSNSFQPVILSLQTLYPRPLSVDASATLLHVSTEPMQVSVIYVDDSRCSESVCALPLDVEAREPVSGSDGWSFLLQYDPMRGRYQLLGLGGDDAANGDGIWGFSWLPQLITSSVLANNGILGVHTVTSVHKEVTGIINIGQNASNAFVAGFRESTFSPSNCTGAVVSSRYVLTAASCFKRGDFQ